MTSKKQLNEIESSIVVLDERLEKLEEQLGMMKQMISMQNALIENMQMMMKMMSTTTPDMTGGKQQDAQAVERQQEDVPSLAEETQPKINKKTKEQQKSSSVRERFLRVI